MELKPDTVYYKKNDDYIEFRRVLSIDEKLNKVNYEVWSVSKNIRMSNPFITSGQIDIFKAQHVNGSQIASMSVYHAIMGDMESIFKRQQELESNFKNRLFKIL